MKLFKSTAEQVKHLIFTKPHPEWVGAKERIDPNAWFPRKVRLVNLRAHTYPSPGFNIFDSTISTLS